MSVEEERHTPTNVTTLFQTVTKDSVGSFHITILILALTHENHLQWFRIRKKQDF